MKVVRQYLLDKQWSMGNGQCPECCGAAPGPVWKGHPCFPDDRMHGHALNCALADAMREVGMSPIKRTMEPD